MRLPRRPAPGSVPWADRPAVAEAQGPSVGEPLHPSSTVAPHGVPEAAAAGRDPEPAGPVPVTAAPGTGSAVLTAVFTGVVAGSVATAMHGSIWYLPGGVWLPWGLLFSGALLWFASVWSGTSTRRVWAAAVPGLLTYVLAWSFAYLKNGSALVVTTWDAPIGIVGYAWFAVVFVAVMAAVIVTGRWLMVQRRAAASPVPD